LFLQDQNEDDDLQLTPPPPESRHTVAGRTIAVAARRRSSPQQHSGLGNSSMGTGPMTPPVRARDDSASSNIGTVPLTTPARPRGRKRYVLMMDFGLVYFILVMFLIYTFFAALLRCIIFKKLQYVGSLVILNSFLFDGSIVGFILYVVFRLNVVESTVMGVSLVVCFNISMICVTI
jgi:hypothetical protein